jgi:SAM-dependent methyltransferase
VRPARKALLRSRQRPRIGEINWGDFDRTRPINSNWGFERGTPIDRYFIDAFLEKNAGDIRGRVLEMSDNSYTKQFGGTRVEKSDVLHPTDDNPRATIIADLTKSNQVTDALFDCIICTQTLQFIFEASIAVESLFRFLKPGGVLLLTVPGISQISPEDMDSTGDYWRFTTVALQRLLGAQFPVHAVSVESHGNVKTSIGLLHGISAEEVSDPDLKQTDPHYQLLLSARAQRPG